MMQQTIYVCPWCGLISIGEVTPINLHIVEDHPDKDVPEINQLILDPERLGNIWEALIALAPEQG